MTKLIVVVQVFIAEREGEHALADQGLDRVLEQSWVAPVGETAGHPTDQPEAAIQPPQQQPSGIRCDDSAIEPGHNLVPFNRFKFEQCWATLCLHRGLSGIAVSDWRIAIFRDFWPRCITWFEKSGLDMLREASIDRWPPDPGTEPIIGTDLHGHYLHYFGTEIPEPPISVNDDYERSNWRDCFMAGQLWKKICANKVPGT